MEEGHSWHRSWAANAECKASCSRRSIEEVRARAQSARTVWAPMKGENEGAALDPPGGRRPPEPPAKGRGPLGSVHSVRMYEEAYTDVDTS